MRVVKKPEERRAEMIAAASRLFAEQGFVKTSVTEIVTAVDVAKGLFYYYFTTKNDMVKAVVEGLCSYMGTLANTVADGEGTGLEKIDRLLEHRIWAQCFTQPLIADLCMPQHTALYADMCDRMYTHMGPAIERMTAQALREKGRDDKHAGAIMGVGLYGILMMARKGDMNMNDVGRMIRRLIASETDAA
ncbi:MAG: TetR/AcrR family transcriptional regulator [Clostridia bacterium]|nr:TetR/AcrR family transcriptional regulator [Clostridia bacterium]